MTLPVPTEAQEGLKLVQYLRVRGLKFSHVANETGGSLEARRRAVRVKQQGVSKGFPDYIVLIPPQRFRHGHGMVIAIELKRQRGSAISQEQREWIEAFNSLASNVVGTIARGADAAINQIEDLLISYDREAA